MKALRLSRAMLLIAMAVACRQNANDDGRSGHDAGPRADGSMAGDDGATIYDVQSGKIPAGAKVKLVGVVVTAVDSYGKRVGGVYVEEPEGGPNSGVFVFIPQGGGSLAPGDIVTVDGGTVQEYSPPQDITGKTLTEISPPMGSMITVTKTGTGQVPAPAIVDPILLHDDPNEAEKWEGVLVTLVHVAVVKAPHTVSSTDPTLTEALVTGPFAVSSSLTALDSVKKDDCVSVTGIVDYIFDYKLAPRSAEDIVTGDAADCSYENDAALCKNELDDDHDGFADCMDFGCQVVEPSCTTVTTVSAVQMGAVAKGTKIQIVGAIVTAKADKTVWVEDAAGGMYSGVAVFFGSAGSPADIAVGDVVTVDGTVTEYKGASDPDSVTEIENATFMKTGTGTVPEPVTIDDAKSLADATTAEPYEGVLVKVSRVAVLTVPDSHGEWTVGDATKPLSVDDLMLEAADLPGGAPTVGECLTSIVGTLHYGFGVYKLEPRSAADVTRGGSGCP